MDSRMAGCGGNGGVNWSESKRTSVCSLLLQGWIEMGFGGVGQHPVYKHCRVRRDHMLGGERHTEVTNMQMRSL